ncbi:MAG: hypothetical protein GQ569_08870 [Methylococcaceae bacterium]|nr:hypothetical protein [Methylococcaceae bacterium]
MQVDGLITILQELNSSSPDIEASAVISTVGLVIASVLPQNLDEDRVGAMTAALLSRAERTAIALDRGELKQFFLIAKQGGILMVYVGEGALLAVLTKPHIKSGFIFFTIERLLDRIVEEINKITVV